MKRSLSIFCLLVLSVAEAKEGAPAQLTEAEQKNPPWFTGPLLTPSGHIVPAGYINVEPYLYASVVHAHYNKNWDAKSIPNIYAITPQIFLQIGLTKKMDFTLIPQMVWQETQGKSAARLADMPIGLGYQLLLDTENGWWPAIKLFLHEVLPLGHYQRLDPAKLGTDSTGTGSFITEIGVVFSRLFWFGGSHYLNPRLALAYDIPARVHVAGFNTYGGGYGTHGYVYPGQALRATLGLEFSLTRQWVLACDFQYAEVAKTRFKGTKGILAPGIPASVGVPSFSEFSLAPAIEYNWNESLGIIGGCWFTVAGRNAADFATAVIALNYYTSIGKKKN